MKKRRATLQASPHPVRPPADTGLEALAWAVSSGSADKVLETLRAKRRRRQRRRVAAAACAAVVLGIASLVWQVRQPVRPVAVAAASSAVVSLPTTQVLPDGSRVEIKDGAELTVAFDPEVRRVVLRKGEAHFEVVSDPSRDFVVATDGRVEVRAIGTAFSVERAETHVDVLVTEGRVAVVARSGAAEQVAEPHAPILVDAGRQLTMEVGAPSPQPVLRQVSAAEQSQRLAWRVPRLEFSGTPLREAIAMFNQYGRVRLVLDPVLGALQMSGTLRADDIDSLLLFLRNEFGIHSEHRSDGAIRLFRP